MMNSDPSKYSDPSDNNELSNGRDTFPTDLAGKSPRPEKEKTSNSGSQLLMIPLSATNGLPTILLLESCGQFISHGFDDSDQLFFRFYEHFAILPMPR